MKTSARFRSSYVSRWISTLSSEATLSRSASVARTAPWGSKARTPKKMASCEYHTSTSVESGDGRWSTGWYTENPVSTAARLHAGSSRTPSTVTSDSMAGTRTSVSPSRAL